MIGDMTIFGITLLLCIVYVIALIALAMGIINTWSKFDDCMDKYLEEK